MATSYDLDSTDKKLLALIERKPYKAYRLLDLMSQPTPNQTLAEREDISERVQARIDRLVELGLITQETFYMSPKTNVRLISFHR